VWKERIVVEFFSLFLSLLRLALLLFKDVSFRRSVKNKQIIISHHNFFATNHVDCIIVGCPKNLGCKTMTMVKISIQKKNYLGQELFFFKNQTNKQEDVAPLKHQTKHTPFLKNYF